jgi:hypothetical protein
MATLIARNVNESVTVCDGSLESGVLFFGGAFVFFVGICQESCFSRHEDIFTFSAVNLKIFISFVLSMRFSKIILQKKLH